MGAAPNGIANVVVTPTANAHISTSTAARIAKLFSDPIDPKLSLSFATKYINPSTRKVKPAITKAKIVLPLVQYASPRTPQFTPAVSRTINARTPTRVVTDEENISDEGASILLITFTAKRNVDKRAHAHAEKYPLPKMANGESTLKVSTAVVIPHPRKNKKEYTSPKFSPVAKLQASVEKKDSNVKTNLINDKIIEIVEIAINSDMRSPLTLTRSPLFCCSNASDPAVSE